MEMINHIIFFISMLYPIYHVKASPSHQNTTHIWFTSIVDGFVISAAVVSFVTKALIPSSMLGKFEMVAVHVSALS